MAGRGAGGYGAGGDWELLFGSPEDAQLKAQALAQALRGQQRDALALQALTGGPRAAPQIGQTLAANAQQELGGLGQAAGERLRMAMQERARQAQLSQNQQEQAFRERQFGETQRHNRAVEARPAASPMTIVTGEGGQLFYANPRDPNAPAQPVVGPDSKPVVKPRALRPIPNAEKVALQNTTGEYRALDDLEKRFTPDLAGGGPLGSAATSTAQKLGSWGSKGMQKNAAFWADFSRLVDLPQRNAVFGASLTSTEKSSWEGAKNIRPGTSPELVKAKLAEMKGILGRKLQEHGQALLAEGYQPEAVEALTGGIAAGRPAAAARTGRVRVVSPNGKRGTIDAGELEEAITNGWTEAD